MISVLQSPATYSPAGDPLLFRFQSNNSNLLYFKAEVKEVTSSTTIYDGTLFPTPANPSGASINLSSILYPLVKWELMSEPATIIYPVTKPVINYSLTLIERGYSGGTIIDLDVPFSGTTYFAWNAQLDKFNFNHYTPSNFVWGYSGGTVIDYLTYKPDNSIVNDYSFEQLFILNDSSDGLYLAIEMGTTNYIIPFDVATSGYTMFGLQVSPQALKLDPFDTIAFSGATEYSIYVVNLSGQTVSNKRTYQYQPLPCGIEPVNICWINSLGGLDSYQFQNPQEQLNVTRATIQKNTLIDGDSGFYVNMGIYNVETEIYNSSPATTIKVYSRELSDAESAWMTELMNSQQAFVVLNDNTLVPIVVTNTQYNVQKKKYLTSDLNILELTFTLPSGIIPANSQSVSIIANK